MRRSHLCHPERVGPETAPPLFQDGFVSIRCAPPIQSYRQPFPMNRQIPISRVFLNHDRDAEDSTMILRCLNAISIAIEKFTLEDFSTAKDHIDMRTEEIVVVRIRIYQFLLRKGKAST